MLYTDHYPFHNWPLRFPYNAFLPFLTEVTVQIHHDIQAQAYVDNLNYLLRDKPELQEMTLEELIVAAHSMPVSEGRPILRNAGGIYNHRLYFEFLEPPEDQSRPSPALLTAVQNTYGDVETMLTRFKSVSLSVFGSGYSWLVATPGAELGMIITVNQDTPLPLNLCPLLNVDVWEHAYYLMHYYNRGAYLDNLFHVINWDIVSRRFEECNGGAQNSPL